MSLKERLKKNFGASIFAKVTGSLIPLATVPLCLHYWGNNQYGFWLVISSIPSWLIMSDLGIGSAAANAISMQVSRRDTPRANEIFQSAFVSILAVSFLGLLLVPVFSYSLPLRSWLSLAPMTESSIGTTVFILGITTLISLQVGLFMGVLRANGHAALGFICTAIKPVLDIAFMSIALAHTSGFVGVALALLLSQCVYVLIYGYLAYRKKGLLQFGFSYFSKSAFIYCLRNGLTFSLFPLGNALLLQGSLLAVNAGLGPQAVVVFGVVRTMTRGGIQLIMIINQSIWPEMSHLIGAGDWSRAQTLHRASVLLSVVASIGLVALVVITGPTVFGVWTTHHLTIARPLLFVFSLMIFTNTLWSTSSVVLAASNEHGPLAARYFIGTGLSVPLCYFMSLRFGLVGAALSGLLADAILIPYVLSASISLTKDTWPKFISGMGKIVSLPLLR